MNAEQTTATDTSKALKPYRPPALLVDSSYSGFASLLISPDARVMMIWGPPWTSDSARPSSPLYGFADRMTEWATDRREHIASQTLFLSAR